MTRTKLIAATVTDNPVGEVRTVLRYLIEPDAASVIEAFSRLAPVTPTGLRPSRFPRTPIRP